MSGKFHQNINEKLLFRLAGLFQVLNRTLFSFELSDDEKLSKLRSEFYDCRQLVGADISNYVTNNVFCLQEFKDKKSPKQYIHVKSKSFKKPFEICLN